MTRKILLIHNEYIKPGGESIVFENQEQGLKNTINIIFSYKKNNLEIDNYTLRKKIQMFFYAFYSPITTKEITQLINNKQPDIAIVQNTFPLISPSIYSILNKKRIPIIQAIYNYRFLCPNAEFYINNSICEKCKKGNTINAVKYKCYKNSYLQSLWYAAIIGLHKKLGTFKIIDSFMVPDQFIINKFMEAGYDERKFFINPNPFDVKNYPYRSTHDNYFLYVGRLNEQKGIQTLIKSYIKFKIKSKLVIIGSGEKSYIINLQKIITENHLEEIITLKKPVWGEKFIKLLLNSKAVIIPSEWYDNLPQILCQANAAGKPVIASAINGIPEYVIDGVNGFLFQTGKPQDLYNKIDLINNLSEEQYTELSNNSRNFAENNLDYELHKTILLKKINQIINETQG